MWQESSLTTCKSSASRVCLPIPNNGQCWLATVWNVYMPPVMARRCFPVNITLFKTRAQQKTEPGLQNRGNTEHGGQQTRGTRNAGNTEEWRRWKKVNTEHTATETTILRSGLENIMSSVIDTWRKDNIAMWDTTSNKWSTHPTQKSTQSRWLLSTVNVRASYLHGKYKNKFKWKIERNWKNDGGRVYPWVQ